MRETLKEGHGMSFGMTGKIMILKDWYLLWSANVDPTSGNIKEVSIQTLWNEFLMEREKAKHESAEKFRNSKEEEEENKVPTAKKTAKASSTNNGINTSYKVETKEFPTLMENKLMKGKCFDEWYYNLYIKMYQTKVADILKNTVYLKLNQEMIMSHTRQRILF
eukprot:5197806-Ditylum_brightwellii.AAC.1